MRRSAYFQMWLFCCASRCQMLDPTALRQGLQLVFVLLLFTALALHVRLMMQPPKVRRPQRGRSSLHHVDLTRLEASHKKTMITDPCQVTPQASFPQFSRACSCISPRSTVQGNRRRGHGDEVPPCKPPSTASKRGRDAANPLLTALYTARRREAPLR